jgi:hypothetical protein
MKKALSILACCLLLSGCASQTVPDWKNIGYNQLENYKKNYLTGKDFIAETNFRKATDEIKNSGDLDALAKAYLTKFGVQTALLETFRDEEYLDIEEILPNPEYLNFYNFLRGILGYVDGSRLPSRYQGVFNAVRTNNTQELEKQINNIGDPLSRLIATGVAVRQKCFNEAILKNAVETASANGWRKALLVYLTQLQRWYEKNNETAKADKTRKTILLLKL